MASMSTPLLSKETHITVPGKANKDRELRLYRAAISGQWEIMEQIYKYDPELINAKINNRGETALHVAAAAGHTQFVKEIIDKMTPDARRLKNDGKTKGDDSQNEGNTAFCHAAISGNVEIAKIMWEKDNGLVTIRGKKKKLPLYLAAFFGHKEMADFLYEKTLERVVLDSGVLEDQDRQDLLVTLIESDIYDVAKKLVEAHSDLAAAVKTVGKTRKTAFNALAGKNFDHQTPPIAWKNGINLRYGNGVQEEDYDNLLELVWDKLLGYNDSTIFDVIKASETSQESGNDSNASQGGGKISEPPETGGNDSQISKVIKSYNHQTAQGNVEFRTTLTGPSQVIKSYNQAMFTAAAQENVDFLTTLMGPSQVTKSYNQAIFTAAAEGNVKFLVKLIGSYPDLLYELDENRHSIFHIAVLHRQEHVFALIKTIGSIKYFLTVYTHEGNNMLHLAGELSPPKRLDNTPGAAFQLQRELLWFEEVKKVVQPDYIEAKNDEGRTPRDLFLKRHQKLIDDGKTWMKETADKYILVATLFAGVVFGAAISVPGGTDGGVPVLLKQTSFQVFVVADGLSLMFTIIAMLDFFSIRTSRSKLEDCLVRLPMMLLFGLLMLFISIVALMVAFVVAIFIVFGQGKLGLSVPIAALAPLAVLLFICLQRKLIGDVIRATCFSNLLFKPNKYSLLSEWKKQCV